LSKPSEQAGSGKYRAIVVEDEPAPTAFVTARPNLNHRFDRSVMPGRRNVSVAPKAREGFGPRG
jgi:hypothetical protein